MRGDVKDTVAARVDEAVVLNDIVSVLVAVTPKLFEALATDTLSDTVTSKLEVSVAACVRVSVDKTEALSVWLPETRRL